VNRTTKRAATVPRGIDAPNRTWEFCKGCEGCVFAPVHTCQRPTVVLFVPHRLALGIAERPLSPLVFVTLGAVRALGSRDDGDNAGTPNRVLVPMAWTKTGAASEKCTDSYDRECVEPGALLPTTRIERWKRTPAMVLWLSVRWCG
jgi:hypothetical protein